MSSASLPFSIETLPDDFDIPMHSYCFGHQGDLPTGLPVAYNQSSPLYAPNTEHTPPVDVDAEWMAALEKMPLHNQPVLPEARGLRQTVAIANEQSLCIAPPEDPFRDLVVVNTSLPLPYIDDPRFTGRVEDTTALAPVFMSPLRTGIALMGDSLDKFSTETPESSLPPLGTLLHSWVLPFPKAALGISPLSTRSAFGSNHSSSGSFGTEALHTPLEFPQQATMAAKPVLSNIPSGWDPFVTTHEIATMHSYPSPPISYTSTLSPLFLQPKPPPPPTDGFPPHLYILPDSDPLPRTRRYRPRPVVCEKHFEPSPADARFSALMKRARADPELREPAMLKRDFCSRNKGACPQRKRRSSTCFTILVGPFRGQCRTESVALRNIQKVLGLCWTCNTW